MKIIIIKTELNDITNAGINTLKFINTMLPDNLKMSDDVMKVAIDSMKSIKEFKTNIITIIETDDEIILEYSDTAILKIMNMYNLCIKLLGHPCIKLRLYDLLKKNWIINKCRAIIIPIFKTEFDNVNKYEISEFTKVLDKISEKYM